MDDDAASRGEIRDAGDSEGPAAEPGEAASYGEAAPYGEAEPPASSVSVTRPPQPRRSGNPLRVALVVTFVAVGLLAGWYAHVYARRAALLDLQQACLDYAPPAESVVYEENPERAAELLARG